MVSATDWATHLCRGITTTPRFIFTDNAFEAGLTAAAPRLPLQCWVLKEPVKETPKQIPRPNERRNDKPPKKKKQVSFEGTRPCKRR